MFRQKILSQFAVSDPQEFIGLPILPFAEIYSTVAKVAKQELQVSNQSCSETAIEDALHLLMNQLSSTLSPVIYEEFHAFRPMGSFLFSLLDEEKKSTLEYTHYLKFLKIFFFGKTPRFFRKYPLVLELIANSIECWKQFIEEMFQRLDSNASLILHHFFTSSQKMGELIHIQGNLSDSHARGKTVLILTFETGHKLVYKPKPLQMEFAFSQLIDQLNGIFLQDSLRAPKILCQEGYGFSEFISFSHVPPSSLPSFYRKAGKLLALAYILRGTDLHFENLIVDGENPILIDVEMLLQPMFCSTYKIHNYLVFNEPISHSVLTTHLLPEWMIDFSSQQLISISAFSNHPVPFQQASWKKINSDEMQLSYEWINHPNSHHLTQENPSQYILEIENGFTKIYDFFMKNKNRCHDLLKMFEGIFFRYLHRETAAYAKVIKKSLQPEALRSQRQRNAVFKMMHRAFTLFDEQKKMYPILFYELKALKQLDIPVFYGKTTSSELFLDSTVSIPSYFPISGLESVYKKIQALSTLDKKRQVENIRLSFNICSPKKEIHTASQIADELCRMSFNNDLGWITWNGITDYAQDKTQCAEVGINLYEGRVGICLFLSAFASLSGDTQYSDFVLRCLDPIVFYFETASDKMLLQFIEAHGIGIGTGFSSLIFGFLRILKFLRIERYLNLAKKLARALSKHSLSHSTLDIISGSAGALLAFLALYEECQDLKFLDGAKFFANHLLNTQQEDGSWQLLNSYTFNGFAHGTTGIAYSLIQYYRITRDEKALEKAAKGFHFEHKYFTNIPKLAAKKSGWCHGLSGYLLARMKSKDILDSRLESADFQSMLTLLDWQIPTQLCCGQGSYAELFSYMNINSNDERWLSNLRQSIPSHPGLFQGIAGIGYQLLHKEYPLEIPSILLWETRAKEIFYLHEKKADSLIRKN